MNKAHIELLAQHKLLNYYYYRKIASHGTEVGTTVDTGVRCSSLLHASAHLLLSA